MKAHERPGKKQPSTFVLHLSAPAARTLTVAPNVASRLADQLGAALATDRTQSTNHSELGEAKAMVSIVTQIRLKEGSQHEWDTAMRERMAATAKHPGWIGGQADWQAWHQDPKFTKTRAALEGLATEPEQHTWCRVIVDVRGK